MSWARIASVIAGSLDSNGFTTGAIDTTGADLIVLFIGTSSATYTVSDNKGNTYIPCTQAVDAFSDRWGQFFYIRGPIVGSGHTFICAGTAIFPILAAIAYSGSATSPFDVENNANGGFGTSTQTGSVSPSVDNELVIAGLEWDGDLDALSIDSGFTKQQTINDNTFGHNAGSIADLIQTAKGAVNPTWTWGAGNSARNVANIVTFRSTAATVTWNHLQTTAHDSGAAVSAVAYGSNILAGSLLLATVGWDAGSSFVSLQDSKLNIWTQINTELSNPAGSSPNKVRMYWAISNGAGADTVTATVSGSPTFNELYISEYSGLAPSQVDASNKGTQSSVYSISAAAAAANELVYGFLFGATTSTVQNAPVGWTTRSSFDGKIVDVPSVQGSNAMTLAAGSDGDIGLFMAIFSLPLANLRVFIGEPRITTIYF